MRHTINSPLPSCQLPESGQLTPYQTVGIVTELAINHSDYEELSVEKTLARVLPALECSQARVFLDSEQRPYGYASWVTLPRVVHQSLLAGEHHTDIDTVFSSQTLFGTNLWFVDLLSPFSSALQMLRALNLELSVYANAYLMPPQSEDDALIRRLW